MKQRVAAYCRVSTLFEEQERSFATQCAYYRQLIENSEDMELVDIYADQMSGLKTEDRKEFQRMLQDCYDGKIDKIITRSVSRFSRNMSDCVAIINELKALGIPIEFEKEHIISTNKNSELFLSVLASMAQEESNHISMNIRWSIHHRAEMGIPSRRCAYGYRHEPKPKGNIETYNRKWLIVESEARRVRKAFQMANELYSYQDILEELNLMEQAEGTDIYWQQHRLYRLLRNEAYRGDILFYKTYCPDYTTKKQVWNKGEHEQFYIEEHHEPLVNPEIFDRVNRLMDCGLLHTHYKAKRRKFMKEAQK